MVIRGFLWHKYQKTTPLGKFKPKLSLKLNELFKRLYPLIAVGKEADMIKFGPITHEILYYSFTMATSIKDQVATATEQSVIFSILTPEKGKYLSPKVLSYIFAHMQRTGFSAILHVAWEGGIEKKYIMEDRSKISDRTEEDNEDNDEEDDDEEDDDEKTRGEEDNEEQARGAESEMGDVEEEAELRTFHDQECSVPPGQDCSPVGDFYEETGSGSNSVTTASLDDNAMEIISDRPDADGVKRLDAHPRVFLLGLTYALDIEFWLITRNGSRVMEAMSAV
jgi:hypothetical protein